MFNANQLRKIDFLVANHVLGPSFIRVDSSPWAAVPFYTCSIEDSWEVAEKLRERYDLEVGRDRDGTSYCRLYSERKKEATPIYENCAASIPQAICLTALQASGIDVYTLAGMGPDASSANWQEREQEPVFASSHAGSWQARAMSSKADSPASRTPPRLSLLRGGR